MNLSYGRLFSWEILHTVDSTQKPVGELLWR